MGRVRETLHDVLRQTDAVLLALCVASTLYGMVLIASATSFRGTLKYVAVQGLGLLIGLALYLFPLEHRHIRAGEAMEVAAGLQRRLSPAAAHALRPDAKWQPRVARCE